MHVKSHLLIEVTWLDWRISGSCIWWLFVKEIKFPQNRICVHIYLHVSGACLASNGESHKTQEPMTFIVIDVKTGASRHMMLVFMSLKSDVVGCASHDCLLSTFCLLTVYVISSVSLWQTLMNARPRASVWTAAAWTQRALSAASARQAWPLTWTGVSAWTPTCAPPATAQ